MVFYNFCYYFLSQHCCLTETSALLKTFLFFYKFASQSPLLLPPTASPTAALAATCGLFSSTYKCDISTDTIVEIQVTKLLTKLLTESHWH